VDVPNAETRSHPDQLTGADAFDVPESGLSPTDPAGLVPWLRALPVGTVLLDNDNDAWQVRQTTSGHVYMRCVVGDKSAYLNGKYASEVVAWAPFRIIRSSGGGR